MIRRFDLSAIPAGGYAASAGEVFASGLRNETGLSIDSQGRIWGVENGRDNLMVGGDIHFDNPAEEVNLFDTARPGRNYGYPFCWSEGIWMGAMAKGPGSQHLDPDQPGGFTEAMCQTTAMVVPPAFRCAPTSRRWTSSIHRVRLPVRDCAAACSSRRTDRGTARAARSAASSSA